MTLSDNQGQTAQYSLEWFKRQDPGARREALADLAERGRDGDIAILVASLSDESPGVQQAAINGLIHIGGGEVVTRLVGMLREPPAIRSMAMEVIEKVGADALESAIPALGSADPNVRKMIGEAIGKPGPSRSIPLLLALLEDPNANVQASVAEALGHLAASPAGSIAERRTLPRDQQTASQVHHVVAALLKVLRDEEWVAFSAIAALAEIGDPAALPSLLGLIQRGPEALRYIAIDAVAQLDWEGSAMAELAELALHGDKALRPTLVKALVTIAERTGTTTWATDAPERWLKMLIPILEHEDPGTRLSVITGLGYLRDRRATGPVLDMYRRIDAPSEEIEDRVVDALVGAGGTQELIDAIQHDEDRAGAVAIRALGELRSVEAVAALAAVRRTSRDWRRRILALDALSLIDTEEAMDAIVEAVDDSTGYVRREAARLLSRSGRTTIVRTLLARLRSERYQDVREQIVESLVGLGTPEVKAELLELLGHDWPPVRESAARGIGLAKMPEGLEPLMCAIDDPEWRVRKAVIEAIGRYDDARALPSLILALSDDHEAVRLAATVGVARWKTPDARKALMIRCLRDSDLWVRHRAVERLGGDRITEAVPALVRIATLRSNPTPLRCATVKALGRIGGAQAQDVLSQLLNDEESELHEAAEQALKGLSPEARDPKEQD